MRCIFVCLAALPDNGRRILIVASTAAICQQHIWRLAELCKWHTLHSLATVDIWAENPSHDVQTMRSRRASPCFAACRQRAQTTEHLCEGRHDQVGRDRRRAAGASERARVATCSRRSGRDGSSRLTQRSEFRGGSLAKSALSRGFNWRQTASVGSSLPDAPLAKNSRASTIYAACGDKNSEHVHSFSTVS